MDWFYELNPELVAIPCFLAVAGVGGWLHAPALTLFGALGFLASSVLYLWERTCLIRLTYTRRLSQHRAEFGETVHLDCELENDKIVPLPWVRVHDVIPVGLEFPGLTTELTEDGTLQLIQAFSLLPFQRSRRRIAVTCDHRGRHRFGASEVRSGDPLGLRHRVAKLDNADELIVYPKVFPLPDLPLVARTPIGEQRVRAALLADPARIAGMRPYRPGDPLRHVDWRSTARSGELLVRDFEATTSPRIAVFFDLARGEDAAADEAREFGLSLAASSLVSFATRRYPVGLFGPGLADGEPIGFDPTSAPGGLGEMLELLALCEPDPHANLAGVLNVERRRLRRQALVLVISSRFSETVVTVLAEVRRRAAVTALFVEGDGAIPPPAGTVDRCLTVIRPADWRHADALAISE